MPVTIKKITHDVYSSLSGDNNAVFSSPEWTGMFGDRLQYCGIYEDSHKLVAGFYYYCDNRAGIPFYHCPPYTPHNGFIFKLSSKNFSAQHSEIKRLMSCAALYFNKLSKKGIVRIIFPHDLKDMQVFTWEKFKVSPLYTYRISLEQSMEEIQSKMLAERRNDIKKAQKDGIICELSNETELIRNMNEKMFHNKSVSASKTYLHKILQKFAGINNSYSFISKYKENVIASVFCIYDSSTVYYLLGSTDESNKHSGAGALALWYAIEHAKNLGLKTFDFEGSMIKPVEKYFRGFGGELTPYYTAVKAPLLIEMLLKLQKRELF
ncbi:MAG: FemAB family protein [Bacteroidetes bacterium ADurb.Bin408]|nr:MAG: FemAB family protein [Bacteroidetes bacterium ADurb.Bin408]